ncbi:putative AMP-binding enzyme [Rosellinia necatrix]|uniref:Putative AMP-binding enzyme n=1 Tax=Rosellinia necatrix TaxID=77044 RepID=A0A1S7UMT7_ROSNE|nr:putative AMP-binding enzyme [Rosellinia necatrix]
MVVTSRWEAPIPVCSLPKWVFGSSFDPLPDTPQFIDPDRPESRIITRAGYRVWSKRIALGLQRAGLKTGDRVLLFSGNNLFFPSVFMGVLMAGGIFTGANPSFVARELAYQLKDSGAYILIAADASMEIAMEAAREAGLPKDRVYSFDATGVDKQKGKARLGSRHWTSLLAPEADAAKFDWVEPADPKATTCCLNYSSGTTGVPKGVEVSHYSYVANCVQVKYIEDLDPEILEKRKTYRQLCFLPCYHAYGQTFFSSNFPHSGVPVYIMPSFDFEKMLQHIQKFRISHIVGVPPIIIALAKHPATRKYDLSSVQIVGSGAAPLGLEISDEVAKLWPAGAVTVRQGWGMTELTCSATAWHPNEVIRSAAVGEIMPNCKARIMSTDGSGEITSPNERGELWISGPILMKGYWRKPEATAGTIHVDSDGTRWLKTGDVAYIEKYEPGGRWHIVDRIKELIKVKGNQVAPAELEAVLLDNNAVTDVAVVGVTINGEELPRAYVVPNPAVKVTEKEIAKWMETRVIRYKWLKGGVKFIDAIPKNPSGKILRKQLKDLAAKEVGDRKPTASKLA